MYMYVSMCVQHGQVWENGGKNATKARIVYKEMCSQRVREEGKRINRRKEKEKECGKIYKYTQYVIPTLHHPS